MQPELTGTASTVAAALHGARLARAQPARAQRGHRCRGHRPHRGHGVPEVARGGALAADTPLTSVAVSADPPPEATGVLVPGANGIVTAPVHLVGPDSEGFVGNVQNGVQTPSPTSHRRVAVGR